MDKDEKIYKIADGKGKKRPYKYAICPQCGKKFLKRTDGGDKNAIRCSRKCYAEFRSKNIRGKNHWHYRDRSMKSLRGMVAVHNDEGKRVYEHRYVYEKHYKVKLSHNDIIHHIDGDKSNNDPENLLKCTRRSHLWMHQAMAYWYQIEVVRKTEIKTRKGLVRFLLDKAHEHIDGMASNVGRNNGDIIPNDLMKIATELGCID